MGIMQPEVTPLPTGLSLEGKVVIVTGSPAGLGLETARQCLALKAATVVLAFRNVSKGEAVKKELLVDSSVKKHNPNGEVKVMKVDMDDYTSISSFGTAMRAELPKIDFLLLNAGLGFLSKYEKATSGHERTLQVNFLSNVLLLSELLPHLQKSAAEHGTVRITWVGSRGFFKDATLPSKTPVKNGETVIQRLDDKERYAPLKQYADSKLLCVMWFYDLACRLEKSQEEAGKGKTIINQMCPDMLATDMSDNLPFPLKQVAKILKSIRARPIEEGGWMLLNAAAVLGPESHGKFILDKNISETMPFINSVAGKKLTEKIYKDTATEMSTLTTVPPEIVA